MPGIYILKHLLDTLALLGVKAAPKKKKQKRTPFSKAASVQVRSLVDVLLASGWGFKKNSSVVGGVLGGKGSCALGFQPPLKQWVLI